MTAEPKHVPLDTAELNRLKNALRGNHERDLAVLVGPDTSFAGSEGDLPDLSDNEVVFQIKSIPCHY